MDARTKIAPKNAADPQLLYLESLARQITNWSDPHERMVLALRNDEFLLYRQNIIPLVARNGARPFLEILVRLKEEETNLTPPGAFIPVMEYYGLMPALDRWIVEHVIAWSASRLPQAQTLCSINLAKSTLADVGFPSFVRERLAAHKVAPQLLCFEVCESDALTDDGVRFLVRTKAMGCQSAIGSFGRGSVSFDSLHSATTNFIKIDGGIVREIVRDPIAAAKTQAIARVCEEKGILTVAEFVETPDTLNALRGIGVNYVQGFGISKPGPLSEVV